MPDTLPYVAGRFARDQAAIYLDYTGVRDDVHLSAPCHHADVESWRSEKRMTAAVRLACVFLQCGHHASHMAAPQRLRLRPASLPAASPRRHTRIPNRRPPRTELDNAERFRRRRSTRPRAS